MKRPSPKSAPASAGETLRDVAAVILAAGSSVRMGRAKQLLPLDGRPLLQHAIDTAVAAGFGRVVLVVGDSADQFLAALTLPREPPCLVVRNEDYRDGMATSLRAGVGAVKDEHGALAILLGDQPRLDPATIRRVGQAFATDPRPVARPVYLKRRPAGEGGGSVSAGDVVQHLADSSLSGQAKGGANSPETVPGHPVFVRQELWSELKGLEGDQGLRDLLRGHPDWVQEVLVDAPAPRDVDTESDYLSLR